MGEMGVMGEGGDLGLVLGPHDSNRPLAPLTPLAPRGEREGAI